MMATIGKFGKGAPAKPAQARPAAAAKKPAQRVSKYANAEEREERNPMPEVGLYRFRVLSCQDAVSPQNRTISWFSADLEIVGIDEGSHAALAAHSIGDVVTFLQQTAGPGAEQGIPRVVTFVRNAAGYDDKEEFRAFDPDGYFVDAVGGLANEYSEAGCTLEGRLVDARVTRGRDNPKKPGDWFRNWEWSVVADDEQDLPKVVMP